MFGCVLSAPLVDEQLLEKHFHTHRPHPHLRTFGAPKLNKGKGRVEKQGTPPTSTTTVPTKITITAKSMQKQENFRGEWCAL